MPSSYLSLHYHLVFSTKHREPSIPPTIAPRLYDYMGGITRGLGGQLLAAGGIPDHVHLLVRLGATRAVADVLRDLKAGSSKWVHDHLPDLAAFGWQIGYGAFAVSVFNLPEVKAYIKNQEEHHRTRTFRQEFVALLDRHGIEYDERYLWD
ncbi:MAG: IS200/IS605 family transposase [Gemmataceae bacterium]